jgi:hypothetical protein
VQVIALAVLKWRIVQDCALTVPTSVTYVQLFVQGVHDLLTSLQVCVLTFVKPVLNNAGNMITNNVNAVLKHVQNVQKYAEAWQPNH